MIPRKYVPAIDELRKLIDASELPLTEIANRSGVSYTSLWKWYTNKQDGIGLSQGERVYTLLTGKTFLEIPKPRTDKTFPAPAKPRTRK